MPNFLLVGNGAREHAVAKAVCKKSGVKLFVCMNAKNPGIMKLCEESGGEYWIGNIEDGNEVAKWAKGKKIDLAFPSPDAVLAEGVADELETAGIKICAPVKNAAMLEWNKAYLRFLMETYKIEGCPSFKHFENEELLEKFIDILGEVAVKPIGLTGGKGVKVTGFQLKDKEEAKKYAKEVVAQAKGGVLVEEKMVGEEFTLMAFCDGKNLAYMPAVQDHKRAGENDEGVNTGGMGSYSDNDGLLPFLKKEEYEKAAQIMEKILNAMRKNDGTEYKGVLYGQFIITKKGLGVVEVNARFGDPEAMNVLPVLKTPLYDVLSAVADGKLNKMKIQWEDKATVVKYIVPNGYPQKAVEPSALEIDEGKIKEAGAELFYSSVDEKNGKIYTSKSRAIAVLGIGNNISEAEKIAEEGCSAIKGAVWHRKDIGTDALVKKRIEHLKEIRGE